MSRAAIIFLLTGTIVGTGIGFFAARSTMPTKSGDPASSTSETDILTTANICSAPAGESLIFSGFSLDGKNFTFSELPPDLKGEVLGSVANTIERRIRTYETAAARYILGREKGSSEAFPELTAIFPEELNVAEQEVRDYFDKNRAVYPKDLTYEQVSGTIRTSLENIRKQRLLQAQFEKISAQGFRINGRRICAETGVESIASRLATIGDSSSQGHLVWITGAFCTECRRLWPLVEQAARSNKVSVIFAGKPDDYIARELNKGLLCAGKQQGPGVVTWLQEAHGLPLGDRQNPGMIRKYVREILPGKSKLDVSAFEECMVADKTEEASTAILDFVNTQNLLLPPQLLIDGKRPLGEQASTILPVFARESEKS